MFTDFISLLPYSIGITLAIIIPSILIAKQEKAIEGPFGWSSTTFTRRWSPNTLVSKVYRAITGRDKWATEYHLISNLIWIMIFFISLLFIPLFSYFAGIKSIVSMVKIFVIAIFCCIQMMWVEDYIWFLIHPFYGPERHTEEYVPWFQKWKAKIPTTYWLSIGTGFLFLAILTIFTKDLRILLIWFQSIVILTIVVFFVFRPLSKVIKRVPLKKYWWEDNKNIIIQRCPYWIEGKDPQTKINALVIDDKTLEELILEKKAIPLEDNLEN
jgi:hypothetical protein